MGNSCPRAPAAHDDVPSSSSSSTAPAHAACDQLSATAAAAAAALQGARSSTLSSPSSQLLVPSYSFDTQQKRKKSSLVLSSASSPSSSRFSASKTKWPVSRLEQVFLPDFPIESARHLDFSPVQEIAQGAFGKVHKIEQRDSGQLYALKVLDKARIVSENAVKDVKTEVAIQQICGHHAFIVNCPYRWQTKRQVCIVTDFVAGGELLNLIKIYSILPVILAKVYIAEIALVLDFLHNAGIVHRDLKPENILLDQDGHLQIIDFGLAAWLPYGSKTNFVCGTRNYMAPEMVASRPYGHAIDWWSMGVIAHLFLLGTFPRRGNGSKKSEEENDAAVAQVLLDDPRLDAPSRDLLSRLLQIDPTKRLRSLRTLQTLAFYKDYNFEDARNKRVSPKQLLQQHFLEKHSRQEQVSC